MPFPAFFTPIKLILFFYFDLLHSLRYFIYFLKILFTLFIKLSLPFYLVILVLTELLFVHFVVGWCNRNLPLL